MGRINGRQRPPQARKASTVEEDPPIRFDPDEGEDDLTTDGDPSADFALENKDPKMHYFGVPNHPDEQAKFRALGGHPVAYVDGGVRFKGSTPKPGELIQVRDQILFEQPRDSYEKRVQGERRLRRERKAQQKKGRRRDLVWSESAHRFVQSRREAPENA